MTVLPPWTTERWIDSVRPSGPYWQVVERAFKRSTRAKEPVLVKYHASPPQSTSVSFAFFTVSEQVGAWQTPFWQTPLMQSAPLRQPWPAAQSGQVMISPVAKVPSWSRWLRRPTF